jgi:hypothetical protein
MMTGVLQRAEANAEVIQLVNDVRKYFCIQHSLAAHTSHIFIA